jgi:hypothetical protein
MITLKEFLEAIDYKITEGSQYLWECYGRHARYWDSWEGGADDPNASVIFDTVTHEVYEVTVVDNQNERGYRMINPAYYKKYKKECKRRGVNPNHMWDDLEYIDLEMKEDLLSKLVAIMRHEEYDTRVSIPLDLTEQEILALSLEAHRRNITLNELMTQALELYVEQHKDLK